MSLLMWLRMFLCACFGHPVSVFGVEDQALAIVDALASFEVTAADPKGHVIVGVEKLGG